MRAKWIAFVASLAAGGAAWLLVGAILFGGLGIGLGIMLVAMGNRPSAASTSPLAIRQPAREKNILGVRWTQTADRGWELLPTVTSFPPQAEKVTAVTNLSDGTPVSGTNLGEIRVGYYQDRTIVVRRGVPITRIFPGSWMVTAQDATGALHDVPIRKEPRPTMPIARAVAENVPSEFKMALGMPGGVYGVDTTFDNIATVRDVGDRYGLTDLAPEAVKFALSGRDGKVYIAALDKETEQGVKPFVLVPIDGRRGETNPVLAFDEYGHTLVTGTSLGRVRVLDLFEMREVAAIAGPVTSVAAAEINTRCSHLLSAGDRASIAHSSRVAVAWANGLVKVFEMQGRNSPKQLASWQVEGTIRDVHFMGDCNRLSIVTSRWRNPRLWTFANQ